MPVRVFIVAALCVATFVKLSDGKEFSDSEKAEKWSEKRIEARTAERKQATTCNACIASGGQWNKRGCLESEGVHSCDEQALLEAEIYDGSIKLVPREPRMNVDEDGEDEYGSADDNSASKDTQQPAAQEGNHEFECDVTGAKFNEADGGYHFGGEDDGLDITVAAYQRFDSLQNEYSSQWQLLPQDAKSKSAWKYFGPPGREAAATATGGARAEFEFECDVTGAQFNEADGGYHFGDPDDGLDITQAAFLKFDSLKHEYAKTWGQLPSPAKSASAWKYFGPPGKKQQGAAVATRQLQCNPLQGLCSCKACCKKYLKDPESCRECVESECPDSLPQTTAPAAGGMATEFEFECDITGAQFNEADGGYHFGDPDDGLDMTQSAYAKFGSLKKEYGTAWRKLPPGADTESAWKYFGPAAKKIEWEFECDVTGDKFNEADGRYHFGSEDNGLDLSVAAYQRFATLKDEFPSAWAKLPKGMARKLKNWKFVARL
jgi:hypothetical protein